MHENNNGRRHSRRDFLKAGAGALSTLGVATSSLGATSGGKAGGDRRPNFVFFLGEGARSDEFSATGNKIISTPHLDRIIQEGITFRNGFVTYALCLPSRASILTGLYPHRTGAIDNRAGTLLGQSGVLESHGRRIPESVPTIADMLRQAGYEVGFFGKAHIRDLSKRNWDTFLGVEAAGANYYRPMLIESKNGEVEPPKQYHGYVDDIVTSRALKWLNQKRDKPFCIFLWFIAPHAPFYRPRRLLDLYNGVRIPKPSTFDDDLKGYPGKPLAFKNAYNKIGTTILGNDDPRSLEELVKDHYAGVVDNDDNAGRIMDALEKAGILDDTAIVVSSDHGFFLGEWRFYDKRFMHEPSIRVPLAIRYPRMIKAGLTPHEMALNIDIPPTILELAGVKVPDWTEWVQGRSLVPFMKGSPPSDWRKDWLYEYFEYPAAEMVKPNRGVRTERYKLIHYFLAPQEFELYDLQEDPGELHNLYGDPSYSKLAKDLLNRIGELRKETGDVYTYGMPNAYEFEEQKY
jgi:arylsulfatase A-like enzyme